MSPPASPAQVLVVDDDDDLRAMVAKLLVRAGMNTLEAASGSEGLRKFYASRPDLVVLDVSMPGMDGFEVLERIRDLSDVPVLLLTARGVEMEKVRGLKSGADDYVTKPFGRQELAARVEALLRRRAEPETGPEVLSDGLVEVDFAQAKALVRGRELSLTPLEFRLLAAFVRNPNQVLSQDQLLELAWSSSSSASREQVKLYVGYLRRKLREAAGVEPLETVRGFGYRYNPGSP
ncbi:MAG: response regulator transcription factor [Actinomycetota bacterium]